MTYATERLIGQGASPPVRRPGSIWGRWVFANAAGEAVGLGAVALVGVALADFFAAPAGLGFRLLLAGGLVVAATLLEGTVIGLAQWLVLRRALPRVAGRHWVTATAAGAFAAWTLGMLPSTLMSPGADAAAEAPPELSAAAVYGLAAVMGLVLGAVLALPQWLVLRRHVRRALWWIPGNAAAWAAGMAVVFVGAGRVGEGAVGPGTAALVFVTLAAAGAVVGAIHGAVLVRLLLQPREP